jgi:hypothetical protein
MAGVNIRNNWGQWDHRDQDDGSCREFLVGIWVWLTSRNEQCHSNALLINVLANPSWTFR